MALVFAVIDGGLLMGRYNNINNATKEGARLGAVGAPARDIVTRVQQQAHGELDGASTNCGDYASGSEDVICVQWITGANGESAGNVGSSVRVLAKYHYKFLTPIVNWFSGGGWTVTACAVQRLERSVAVAAADTLDVRDCAGATGGTPSTPTPVPPTPTATNTPVATPTCDPGNNGNHCRETQTALAAPPTATSTPVPPTATSTPVTPTATSTPVTPTPVPTCDPGNNGNHCRETQTALAASPTATATPCPTPQQPKNNGGCQ